MTNLQKALLILNAWSDKARRAARAKRASKGIKPAAIVKLSSRIDGVLKMKAKKKAAEEAKVPAKKAAKLRKEFQKDLDSIKETYAGLRKQLAKRLKGKK